MEAKPGDENLIGSITSGFSVDLLKQLYNDEDNLFFSPASIAIALSMTWSGAASDTHKEMQQGLFKGADEESVHSGMGGFLRQLNAADQPFTLRTANKLYCQQSFVILDSFLKSLSKNYQNSLESVDFVNETEKTRVAINDWVAEETAQKIKDLLSEGVLNTLTRLVLVNAVYFKGDWKNKFKNSDTCDMPFHVKNGKTVSTPMMFMQEEFPVSFHDSFVVLKLPYLGDALSFAIVLPSEMDGLRKLVDTLTDDKLYELLAQPAHLTNVMVNVPKFKLESMFRLNKVLETSGVKKLFSAEEADLSRITSAEKLHVSDVLHKAFIEVNEEGSEAAAATAVVIMTMCMPPQICCDHPFLFAIWDERQKAVLFVGSYVTPPP